MSTDKKNIESRKILVVFGTRPEAIKLAPLIKKIQLHPDSYEVKVCVTAQHREMLDQVLEFFNISVDFDLNLMKKGQDLTLLTTNILSGLKPILEAYKPDFVIVHGDTTTTMAASLASFYQGIKVCHIEAGLRTYNKKAPFPEELNRQLTARIADYHFAPTNQSRKNLESEGIPTDTIWVTGNTVIDALHLSVETVKSMKTNKEINFLKDLIAQKPDKEIILVTGHRRENHGEGFIEICNALNEITIKNQVHIIYPVHLNPKVQQPVYEILKDNKDITLIEPLSYPAFVWLMNTSKIIITDSGGVQEEAPGLGKPVLVMRNTTERPEAVDAGTVILVGTNRKLIVDETTDLLTNSDRYNKMSRLHNPYGDGTACEKILKVFDNLV